MIKRLKAINLGGKWYVGKGRSEYFPSTQCDTKEDAQKVAYLWMIQDAYNLSEKLYQEAVEKGLLEENCFHDYLC